MIRIVKSRIIHGQDLNQTGQADQLHHQSKQGRETGPGFTR